MEAKFCWRLMHVENENNSAEVDAEAKRHIDSLRSQTGQVFYFSGELRRSDNLALWGRFVRGRKH